MTDKKVFLQQDLPGILKGAELYYDKVNEVYKIKRTSYFWSRGIVEGDDGTWFKLEEQPKKERIKVTILPNSNASHGRNTYIALQVSAELPKEKFPLIKQSIEATLNDDVPKKCLRCAGCGDTPDVKICSNRHCDVFAKTYSDGSNNWEKKTLNDDAGEPKYLCSVDHSSVVIETSDKNFRPPVVKINNFCYIASPSTQLYTKEQLLQAEERAFNAARDFAIGSLRSPILHRYPTFQDYLNSKGEQSKQPFEQFKFKGMGLERLFKGTERVEQQKGFVFSKPVVGLQFYDKAGMKSEMIMFDEEKFSRIKNAIDSIVNPTPSEPATNAEQDWEVTEIICYSNEVRILVDGLYRIFDDGVGFDLAYLMERKDAKIKTVRRKSDNQIFTVGDEIYHRESDGVPWNNDPSKILSFCIMDKMLIVTLMSNQETNPAGDVSREICDVKKLQAPSSTIKEPFKWTEKLWDEFEKKVYSYCNDQTPLKIIQELMNEFKKSSNPSQMTAEKQVTKCVIKK